MSDLSAKSKKELIELIDQLKGKLSEMREVEKKVVTDESHLPGYAFSIFQNSDDSFHQVFISYNAEKLVAKVEKVVSLETKNYQNVMLHAKKELVEKIMNKDQINHKQKGTK